MNTSTLCSMSALKPYFQQNPFYNSPNNYTKVCMSTRAVLKYPMVHIAIQLVYISSYNDVNSLDCAIWHVVIKIQMPNPA